MQDDNPETRILTRRAKSLERSLLSAIMVGGGLGICGVIGFALLLGARSTVPATEVRPTAQVVTVTPSPVVPTSTPLPTQAPSATPEGLYIDGHAQVTGTGGDALRLRADAGLQTTTLKTISDGTLLLVLDGPRDVDSIIWWRLRDLSDGAEGWAAQQYLIQALSP